MLSPLGLPIAKLHRSPSLGWARRRTRERRHFGRFIRRFHGNSKRRKRLIDALSLRKLALARVRKKASTTSFHFARCPTPLPLPSPFPLNQMMMKQKTDHQADSWNCWQTWQLHNTKIILSLVICCQTEKEEFPLSFRIKSRFFAQPTKTGTVFFLFYNFGALFQCSFCFWSTSCFAKTGEKRFCVKEDKNQAQPRQAP